MDPLLRWKKTIQNSTNSYTRIKQVSMIVNVLFHLIMPLQLRNEKKPEN